MEKEIPVSQLTAWLVVAISAPVLSLAHTGGWLTVACGVLVGVSILGGRIRFNTPTPKWVGAVELVGVIVYLGAMARESVTCWQDGNSVSFLPVVLLLTAAMSVRNGATQAARSGASLLWFVLPGAIVILLAGISDWKVQNVVSSNNTASWMITPLLLLPLLSKRRIREGKRLCRSAVWIGLGSIAVTLWLNGEVIPQTAANAFYEYAKGITLFGVAERFEAVTACLLTAGWFALFAYLLGAIYEITEEAHKGYGQWTVWTSAAVVILVLYKLPISTMMADCFCIISWGVLPLLTQVVEWLKKSKKSKKNS